MPTQCLSLLFEKLSGRCEMSSGLAVPTSKLVVFGLYKNELGLKEIKFSRKTRPGKSFLSRRLNFIVVGDDHRKSQSQK